MNVQVADKDKAQSKFETDCATFQKQALACIEEHAGDRRRCRHIFALYRECRAAEHHRILAARSGGRF